MKRNRNYLKYSQYIRRRTKTIHSNEKVVLFYNLPDDCWEHVFKFLFNNDNDNNRRYFHTLSVVSPQFHSITNRLKFSLTICHLTQPFLGRLFKRFINLTSLDLTRFNGDLDLLLCEISCFPLNLRSLNLSNQRTIPVNGLRAFSQKITTLTSLTCSNMKSLHISNDLFVIAGSFPLLEELDLSNPANINCESKYRNGIEFISFILFKLRKINLSGHSYIKDEAILQLFKNCELLKEAIIINCDQITIDGIASALRERPTLRCLSFSNTSKAKDAPYVTSHFIDSLVSLKGLTSLDLFNLDISDRLLYSIAKEGLPLTRLVLQNCIGYSYVGIFSLLSKCRCIQHLDLQNADFLNDQHVAELSSFLLDLVSINLSHCSMLTKSSLLSLTGKCSTLSEIKMKGTRLLGNRV